MTATRELATSACQGKLGARAMVRLEPRVVTLYRVEWEYDGHAIIVDRSDDPDDFGTTRNEPLRRVRVKHFRNKKAAYKWMALRLIFAKRDKLATGIGDNGYPSGCRLCDVEPQGAPDDPRFCRYHDHGGDDFERLRARLARWLRWRDERNAS